MEQSSFTRTMHHRPYAAIDPSIPALSARNRIVLVTGAGSGIGQATAIAFAQADARTIVLTGRRSGPLGETKAKIESAGLKCETVIETLDVSSEPDVERVFDTVLTHYGPIDICVHAAGHLAEKGKLTETTLSNYWDTFEVNVKGAFLINHAFLNQTGEDEKERILIHINTSLAHMHPTQSVGPASYAISKLAQAKMIEHSAAENAHRKFRTYAVHPGIISTEMSERTMDMLPPGTRDYIRWDVPELPAHFFVWLASSKGACIPSGRFLWANWDVEELETRQDEILSNPLALTQVLHGWPFEHKG